jgi:hypothetical protein
VVPLGVQDRDVVAAQPFRIGQQQAQRIALE